MRQEPRPIVVDTSAVIDLVLRDERGVPIAAQFGSRFFAPQAPDTIDREVINVLRKRWLRGDLSDEAAEEAFQTFLTLPLELHAARPYAREVWSLRASVHVADAYYLALARQLGASVLTTDERLGRAGQTLNVVVVVP